MSVSLLWNPEFLELEKTHTHTRGFHWESLRGPLVFLLGLIQAQTRSSFWYDKHLCSTCSSCSIALKVHSLFFVHTHTSHSHILHTHWNPFLCSLFIVAVTVKVSQTNSHLTSHSLAARSWSFSALLVRVMTWLWPSMVVMKEHIPFSARLFCLCGLMKFVLSSGRSLSYHSHRPLAKKNRDNILFRPDSFCPIFFCRPTFCHSSFVLTFLSCLIYVARVFFSWRVRICQLALSLWVNSTVEPFIDVGLCAH